MRPGLAYWLYDARLICVEYRRELEVALMHYMEYRGRRALARRPATLPTMPYLPVTVSRAYIRHFEHASRRARSASTATGADIASS